MANIYLAQIEAVHAYVAITVAAFAIVLTWLTFLVWGWRSGQFDDAEQAKYRVFHDGIPSGPGRPARRRKQPKDRPHG